MIKPATHLLLALLLASPAIAQDTTTEDTTTEDTATEETATDSDAPAADPADGLSLGTPILDAEPASIEDLAPGQPYVRDQSGDWSYRCLKAPEGQEDPCQLYQLLQDAEGNDVAEFSIFPLVDSGRAAAGATIVAPLETLLTQQLTLAVDGGNARRYPFTFCNTAGCVSRVGFTQDEVNQFKRGAKATLRMVPAAAPDQEVVLEVSLTGFTAGFDGLQNPE